MSVTVLASPAAVAEAAAARLAGWIRADVAARQRCDLALAGGSTPAAAYRALAAIALPWGAVHLWYGDERCVPPDHPDSNHRMATAALLPAAAAATWHRVRGEDPDRLSAAADYAAALPAALDGMLLGVGPDGHTASLFPGSPALEAQGRAAVVFGDKPPPWRISLTPPVFYAARRLLVLATGREKAAGVAAALAPQARIASTPAALAARGDWLLDTAAAADLPISASLY